MLPSQSQLTGKRKQDDSSNPLLAAAAKRAKKETKAAVTNKRKLNSEEPSGGLMIVRQSETPPPFSQPTYSNHTDPAPPRFSSQPLPSTSTKPPSKKFKAGEASSSTTGRSRAPSQSKPASRSKSALPPTREEAEIDNDVRAMDDESDSLRRKSRLHNLDPALVVAGTNTYAFTPQTKTPKAKSKVQVVPLPERETPQIERNKKLREGAMAAIREGDSPSPSTLTPGKNRRTSVGGRGKRISSSFENTGIITQPHNSVTESSFYKHIDCDLPESERIRQLLIWCTLRSGTAVQNTIASGGKQPSASTSSSETLPPLSKKGAQVLKSVQDDIVRMLAEKKIDFAVSSQGSSTPPEDLGENEQNTKNRHWQVAYSNQIQQAQTEEEAWKKVSYGYEAYTKKLQSSLDKRSAYVKSDPRSLSAKAKGKRRATGEPTDLEPCFPTDAELPTEFHRALSLTRSVLGYQRTEGDDRLAGGGRDSISTSARTGLTHQEMDSEIRSRLPQLEFKLDKLHTYLNSARTTTNLAERLLNQRFDILSSHLTSRVNPRPPTAGGSGDPGSSTTEFLHTYTSNSSLARTGSTGRSRTAGTDPIELMRALTRIDSARHPSQIPDAVRQAAREVQRAGESGAVPVGDRRMTIIPPATPRKAPPGTPRRGNTPSRDR